MAIIVTRIVSCHICGTVFTSHHSQGKYCSPTCSRMGERASWNKYANKNRAAKRSFHRRHYAANRVSVSRRIAAYQKSERGKQVRKMSGARSRARNKDRVAARELVGKELRAGRLVKLPCAKCGNPKTQAHHTDYSKPLDVVWLCFECHLREHGKSPIVIADGEVSGVVA